MAGHSKWSSIKRKKKVNDEKRGKLFSKLASDIRASLKDNFDIKNNFKFKNAVSRALNNNISKLVINKIILEREKFCKKKKLYSVITVQGVIFILECVENNKNKIISDLKNVFLYFPGTLVFFGFVKSAFDKFIKIKLQNNYNEEFILFNLSHFCIFDFFNDNFFFKINDKKKINDQLKLISYDFDCSFTFISKKKISIDMFNFNILLKLKKKITKKLYVFNIFTNVLNL